MRRELSLSRAGASRLRGSRLYLGVTLTEVVVASAILAVAVVPILKALTIAQVTGTTIERKTRSLALAQGKLDEIRAKSVYHYSDSFAASSLSLDGSYRCNVSDNQNATLRTVTVSVGYDADGNGTLSAGEVLVKLTTYVAKRWPGA
jgi:Tfp pilus assembly protein PilV